MLGAVYASLPAWLPTGWLARRIECELAGELQRPVAIGRLHVGWAEGFVIENLIIGDLPGSPNPELARVARLRCNFTPVLTLATGKVDQFEISRPEVWLVRDAEGRLNIEKLPKGNIRPCHRLCIGLMTPHVTSGRPRPARRSESTRCSAGWSRSGPSWTSTAVRWCRRAGPSVPRPMIWGWNRVRAAVCHCSVSSALANQRAPASKHCRHGSGTRAGGGRLRFNARLTVPKLRKDLDLSLGGAVRVEWADLALTDLPLSLIPQLPVEQVGGTTSGMLSFETRPDLSIDFQQRVEAQGVRLMWTGLGRPAIVPDAVLHCDGRWEPESDQLTVRGLKYETQAIQVTGAAGRALRLDPRGDIALEVELNGEIKDWELLRREVPQMDSMAESLGVGLAGRERFALKLSRRGDEGHVALTLNGGRSRWTLCAGPSRYLRPVRAWARGWRWWPVAISARGACVRRFG